MIYNAYNASLGVSSVLFDGQDITRECFFADDEIGYVAVYEVDNSGRIVADANGKPISHGKLGKVVVKHDQHSTA